MQNQVYQPAETQLSTGQSRLTCWPPLC